MCELIFSQDTKIHHIFKSYTRFYIHLNVENVTEFYKTIF